MYQNHDFLYNDLYILIVTSNFRYQKMVSCHFATSVRGMEIENCLSMSVFVMQIS